MENSHASTALSFADGLAKAIRLQRKEGTVVAFVGDGSPTGMGGAEQHRRLGGPAAGDRGERQRPVLHSD